MIKIDYSDLTKEKARSSQTAKDVRFVARNRIKTASLTALRQVKMWMPVDTGAARARWGSPGAPGGIWEEEDEGLTITQGAALEPFEYIDRLNEGSSQQAPAGFLDAIALQTIDKLEQDLANDLVQAWGRP